MVSTFKSCVRSVRIAGGLALAGVAALPLHATAEEARADAAQPAQLQVTASSTSAQVVVRDAETGRLRAATPDEARALHDSRPAASASLRRSAAVVAPQSRAHTSGARGVRLTDEFMSYSVMVRQPDGKLVEICFESKEAAEEAMKASPIAKTTTLPTE